MNEINKQSKAGDNISSQGGGALIEVLIANALFLSVTAGLMSAFGHTESLWNALKSAETSHQMIINKQRENIISEPYEQTWDDIQRLTPIKSAP